MFVTLLTAEGCHTISLPSTITGKYWLQAQRSGTAYNAIGIEAVNGEWCVFSNESSVVLDENNCDISRCVVTESSFYKIGLLSINQFAYLFSELSAPENVCFSKFIIKDIGTINIIIGRDDDCDIRYNNATVSGHHAELTYKNGIFTLTDTGTDGKGSLNGTFVNNKRIHKETLTIGDVIYIMGLKIIIGTNYIAINNPGSSVSINEGIFEEYQFTQRPSSQAYSIIEEKVFSRSPQFKAKLLPCEISVDLPPTKQNPDEIPIVIALGSSMTMGLASMTTALFSVNNAISTGNISGAIPSVVMSVSMLAGSIMWPILSRNYNRKKKAENEEKRLKLYRDYIDGLAAELDHSLFEQVKVLNSNYISLNECFNRILTCDRQLWERTVDDEEFLKLRVGTGNQKMIGEVKLPAEKISLIDDPLIDEMKRLLAKPRTLHDVPITLSLYDNYILGVTGDEQSRYNLIQSIIMQVATLYGYDNIKIALFTTESDYNNLKFVKMIPHFWNETHTVRYIGTNDNEIKEISIILERELDDNIETLKVSKIKRLPYYVLIATDPKISLSVGLFKKILSKDINVGFSILFSANELRMLPRECQKVISSVNGESYILDKDSLQDKGNSFALDTISKYNLYDISCILANTKLETATVSGLPNMVEFLEMYNVKKIEHLNVIERWKNNDPTISLGAPIGVNEYGNEFVLDLHQNIHGPHGLIAGMTGSGKSEFIMTYILSMAINYHPDEVAFVLIDYKGGGMAKAFKDLPHTVGIITNLDGSGVKRSLVSIKSEVDRRQLIFNELSASIGESNIDIYKYQKYYRSGNASEPLPHLFIISDEFAELKQQRPEFIDQLISISRIGRSLGVHLILATQKPAGVVNEQIWSNSKFKICLKVQTKDDSQSMLYRPDAANLVQTGRFYLQVGYNELFEIGQSAWCGAPYLDTDEKKRRKVETVTIIDNIGRPILQKNIINNIEETNDSNDKIKIPKQIDLITEYISNAAITAGIKRRLLWYPEISDIIVYDDLVQKYSYNAEQFNLNPLIGEIDNPSKQSQELFTLPLSKMGNTIIFGTVGSGKAKMLYTIIYTMIANHSVEELNIYIMDFDSETLTAFSDAPQVGGVVLIDEEEKIDKLLIMLAKEINERKKKYIDYGGDYNSYNSKVSDKDPAIVLFVNNITAFEETYEVKLNSIIRIARNGVKYGIYTVMTRIGSIGTRFKLLSCFPQKIMLQASDDSEYVNILGKTEGLTPNAYEGRGLVKIDGSVLEFQTATITDCLDVVEYIGQFCDSLNKESSKKAPEIPILPKHITEELLINAYS